MIKPVPILVPQEIVNDTSVRVISLSCATGQQVSAGHALIELETSKSNIQVESPAAGWLLVLCQVGDDLPVGGVIGHLFETQAELETALAPAASPAPVAAEVPAPRPVPPPAPALAFVPVPAPVSAQPEAPLAPPAITIFSDDARRLLQSSGLDETAFKGRAFVRAADVKALLSASEATPSAEPISSPAESPAPAEDKPFVQTFADEWPLGMLIQSDLHRIDGCHTTAHLLHHWWANPGFRYVMWFRIAQWARKEPWTKLVIYPVISWILQRCHFQSGIRIPVTVKAGPGLMVGHWGSIWISPRCTLGANCTLGNDINIGSAGGAGKVGVPHIGDNVFIGPGARIAGPVKVGQGTAIMPNSLVMTDVPAGSIAIGVPHKVSGQRGTNAFVGNTDYPRP